MMTDSTGRDASVTTMAILMMVLLCMGSPVSSLFSPPPMGKSHEQRLLEDLLRNYEKSVRPVLNSSHAVTVYIGLTLTMIHDLDERNQVLTTNVWLDQKWLDERLTWNASEYGGLDRIRVPCEKVWLPDIIFYNRVDDHNNGYHKALAMVNSSGFVFWPPIIRLASSCKLDIGYFPMDDQICPMQLGSWAYDGFQLDVRKLSDNIDLKNWVDNGEWLLVNTSVTRRMLMYTCCPEPFPDLMFYLHMRRRNLYYVFNVIIPCMILSGLSLVGFILPPASGEKVTLGLTVLLSFSVFMLLIAEAMPPTSELAPLIGIYLTIVMALTSLSVVFAVCVLNLHHRGRTGDEAPRWLMNFILKKAGPWLFMPPPDFKDYYCRQPNRGGGKRDSRAAFSFYKSISAEGSHCYSALSSSTSAISQKWRNLAASIREMKHELTMKSAAAATSSHRQAPLSTPMNHFSRPQPLLTQSRVANNMGFSNTKVAYHSNCTLATPEDDGDLRDTFPTPSPKRPSPQPASCVPLNYCSHHGKLPRASTFSGESFYSLSAAAKRTQEQHPSFRTSVQDDTTTTTVVEEPVALPRPPASNVITQPVTTDTSGEQLFQHEMLQHFRQIISRLDAQEKESRRVKEWQYVAKVTDRLLCIIFVLMTLFSTVYLLLIMPMTKDKKLEVAPDNTTFTGRDTLKLFPPGDMNSKQYAIAN